MKRGGRTPRDGNYFRREREGELLSREERREKRESLPLSLPHARVHEEEKEKERREERRVEEKSPPPLTHACARAGERGTKKKRRKRKEGKAGEKERRRKREDKKGEGNGGGESLLATEIPPRERERRERGLARETGREILSPLLFLYSRFLYFYKVIFFRI